MDLEHTLGFRCLNSSDTETSVYHLLNRLEYHEFKLKCYQQNVLQELTKVFLVNSNQLDDRRIVGVLLCVGVFDDVGCRKRNVLKHEANATNY